MSVFTYGSEKSKRIIKGLSLDIPAGKTTAIVGLSGSGKTTLIKLMLGFYPPTGRNGYHRQGNRYRKSVSKSGASIVAW